VAVPWSLQTPDAMEKVIVPASPESLALSGTLVPIAKEGFVVQEDDHVVATHVFSVQAKAGATAPNARTKAAVPSMASFFVRLFSNI